MSQLDIRKLLERWTTDPAFRKAMRENAESVMRKEGIHLTPEELKTLRAVNWRLGDDELAARISKL